MVSSWWERRANGLPVILLLAYFLITWSESFPNTALYELLLDWQVPVPTIYEYDAVTYFPWMWKPLYGVITDSLPIAGYHRIPYIVFSASGSAALFAVTGVLARSIGFLYVVGISRSMCNAFVQFMVGSFLVDVARRDVLNAAALQSLANAVKWTGTLASQIVARVVYASSVPLLSSREAIEVTALAPGLLALLAFFLPDVRNSEPVQRVRCGSDAVFGYLALLILQGNLVLVGCQYLPYFTANHNEWRTAVIVTASCSLLFLLILFYPLVVFPSRSSSRTRAGNVSRAFRLSGLGAFCFLVNVIPSSGAVLTQLQYTVFSERDVQTLGIIGSASSLVGSLLFGCLNRCGMRRTFFFATLVSLVVNLSALPFVYVVGSHPAMHDIWSQVGGLAVISTVFGGITGMFTILPMDTLITAASGSFRASQSSTAYAVLLSLTAFGNSVGGLISAPIVKSLGLDGYSNWDNLLLWVIVTAALRLLVLPMLALIPSKSLRPASASDLGVSLARSERGMDHSRRPIS